MKLFARLHAIILLAFVAVLYVLWILPSLHPIARAKKAWNRSSTHLVIFGDSWSSNQQLADDQWRERGSLGQGPAPGSLWVDVLCKQIICDRKLNYAQPFPSHPAHQRGSVVDNVVFENATRSFNFTLQPDNISDFKAQVKQFRAEDVSGRESFNGKTVFTVFFGLWEIWTFVALVEADAQRAISESVGSLFAELDQLVDSRPTWSIRPTIIIPKVPDPTWFPRWFVQRTSSSDEYGIFEKQAVFLTEQWNKLLDERAKEYQKADMVLPDFNQWMLDVMREPDKAAYAHTSMLFGKHGEGHPTFTELSKPCVNYTAPVEHLNPSQICSDAAQHLFWDDTRLSGAAHEHLGKSVFSLLQDLNQLN